MKTPPLDEYGTIVLGGGGVKCIATLGALQRLHDTNKLSSVHTYIGTSAGSIIGLLLAVGYTPIEIVVYICSERVLESIAPLDMMSLVTGNGAIRYDAKIGVHIRKLVCAKIGKECISLKELYDTFGVTLVCVSYNLTSNECVYLSHKTHPDLDCLMGVRMSSSLPIVFDECIVDNCVYIDGGVVDNFPILRADESTRVFGVSIFTTHSSHMSKHKIVNLIRLLMSVSSNMYIRRIISVSEETCAILKIDLENVDILDFDKTNTAKLDMFSTGYNASVNFFSQLQCRINK